MNGAMIRRLLQFCFAIALLFTLAVLIVCVRGLAATDDVAFYRLWFDGDAVRDSQWHASAGIRLVEIDWVGAALGPRRLYAGREPIRTFEHAVMEAEPLRLLEDGSGSLSQRLGFAYLHGTVGGRRSLFISAPTWSLLLAGAAASALTGYPLLRARRRRLQRLREGHCLTCGYDLSGAAHERCPECGEAVVLAATR